MEVTQHIILGQLMKVGTVLLAFRHWVVSRTTRIAFDSCSLPYYHVLGVVANVGAGQLLDECHTIDVWVHDQHMRAPWRAPRTAVREQR
jgi:hypothetical protein